MKPDIQSRLELLTVGSGESSKASSAAVVFIIILDLSFFIWDKNPSQECFSQALGVYEKATSNHEAVMRAVDEASRMKQDPEEERERKAFVAKMTKIVLSHRLCYEPNNPSLCIAFAFTLLASVRVIPSIWETTVLYNAKFSFEQHLPCAETRARRVKSARNVSSPQAESDLKQRPISAA
ncbi:hypothetical protein FIBSPDRAFT_885960 [Athelia psychrophila]|uniref:Uncharacterized protein n=1 Tax=Athelia psychrophila TaxID=1759441 RepID=A0A166RAG1_9AGAM|nr:hypothetical protein FIBSPDRAFT_885960 [Fibularhizoctonia sp. CBS 109695]